MKIINNAKKEISLNLRPKNYSEKKNFDKYFEFHHILPKSLFPKWENNDTNIVTLTGREHFFCHQLLVKIYSTSSMFFALILMCSSGKYKYSSREYEKIRAGLSNKKSKEAFEKHFDGFEKEIDLEKFQQFENNLIENLPKIEKVREIPFYKRKTKGIWSLESREKLSKSNKGITHFLNKKHTEETKEKLRQKFSGRKNYWTSAHNIVNKGIKIYCFEDDKFFSSIRELENYYKKIEKFSRKQFGLILKASENGIIQYHGRHYQQIKVDK